MDDSRHDQSIATDQPDGQTMEQALHTARKEAAENWDRYVRSRADMENYKRRIERQYADLTKNTKKGLLLKVLGVMDNLERGLSYQGSGGADRDALSTGLRLTHWQMQELLSSEGIKEIRAVGERFDPRLHEAVDTVPGAPDRDGTVYAETQKGYMYGDDVLRPAKVTVVAGES